jgi:predicted dehydrogenase
MTIAQLGAAAPAAWHMAAYVDAPAVDAVALAEPDDELRSALYDRYGIIKHTTGDYQELLKDDNIAIVDICAPVGLRAELAAEALDAGKHAIVCAPPATSAEFFKRVLGAGQRDARLFVLVPELFVPANREATRLIEEGELGDIVFAGSTCTDWPVSPFDGPGARDRAWPDSGQGLLLDRGYGALTLFQKWMGPVDAVVAAAAGERVQTVDIQMESGAIGQITAIAAVAGDVAVEHRIIGTDASLLIRDDPEYGGPLTGFIDGIVHPVGVRETPYIQRYATQMGLQAILECIENDTEPEFSCDDAMATLRVLDAIGESTESGSRVGVG